MVLCAINHLPNKIPLCYYDLNEVPIFLNLSKYSTDCVIICVFTIKPLYMYVYSMFHCTVFRIIVAIQSNLHRIEVLAWISRIIYDIPKNSRILSWEMFSCYVGVLRVIQKIKKSIAVLFFFLSLYSFYSSDILKTLSEFCVCECKREIAGLLNWQEKQERMTQTGKQQLKHVQISNTNTITPKTQNSDSQPNNNNGNSFLTCVKRHNCKTHTHSHIHVQIICAIVRCASLRSLLLTLCILFDLAKISMCLILMPSRQFYATANWLWRQSLLCIIYERWRCKFCKGWTKTRNQIKNYIAKSMGVNLPISCYNEICCRNTSTTWNFISLNQKTKKCTRQEISRFILSMIEEHADPQYLSYITLNVWCIFVLMFLLFLSSFSFVAFFSLFILLIIFVRVAWFRRSSGIFVHWLIDLLISLKL